jgi:hypothetical protein
MKGLTSRFRHLIVAVLLVLIGAQSSLSSDWVFEDAIEDIIDQVNHGSGQSLTDAIDIDALLSRVFENLEVSDKLKAGFSRTIRASNNLGKNVVRAMPEGSYAKVVLVDQDGETATALIRYDFGGRGYGYHRYDLVKDEAGNVRIIDWMDYLDGFRYSEALKLSAITIGPTAESVRGLVPEHQGSDEDFARFAEVISAYRAQDYQKFYRESVTLSRKLRRTRLMHLLTAIMSRISKDKNLYNDAYRDLVNNFGDDPTVVLTLLNYYYSKGDNDEVMRALRMLQDEFGARDAALLTLMSRTALGLRNIDEATLLADEAISIEPELESAYWAAIDAHVTLSHHSFAVMTAKSLENQFGKSLELERFENNSRYSNLVNSPQFKQWQAEKQPQ